MSNALKQIKLKEQIPFIAIFLAVVLGGFVRFGYATLDIDFPLNDGGLFYQMTLDLMAKHYRIPSYTTYNTFFQIPFAYPPLSFYLAAFTSTVTRWPLLRVFSLLPSIVSILTIPAAHTLMRKLLKSELEAAIGVVIFALLPSGISWVISGGGIARSFGLFFLIVTLSEAYSLFTTGDKLRVLSTAVLLSMCALSHLEYGLTAGVAIVLLLIFYAPNRRALGHTLLTAILALTLTAPWWLTVINHHGLSPFLTASTTGESFRNPFEFMLLIGMSFTDEPLMPVLGILSMIGLFVGLAERDWFTPAWFGSIMIIASRSSGATLSVAMAMLGAIALYRLILPGLTHLNAHVTDNLQVEIAGEIETIKHKFRIYRRYIPALLFTLGLLVYIFYAAQLIAFRAGSPLHVLSSEQREAMEWVSANTPEQSCFLVITSAATWQPDSTTEWFPTLAQRTSLNTVQGKEWLSDQSFDVSMDRYWQLRRCTSSDADCLEAISAEYDWSFTHVYIAPEVSDVLNLALANDPEYQAVYDFDEIQIFEFAGADE